MWARLDDQFYQNAKQLSMSDAAFRLYVCSLSFAADDKAQTGFLGTSRAQALARSLRKGKKQIRELEELKAWEPCEGGWVIHDFDQYVDRGAAERTRKWRRDHGVTVTSRETSRETSQESHGDVSRGSASAGGNPGPVPVVANATNYPPAPATAGEPIKKSRQGRRAAGENPRAMGTNPRALGTNPRARGTNPAATGTNPRALGTNPAAVAADQAAAEGYGTPRYDEAALLKRDRELGLR